ncbi:hypothetical protein GS399_20480 [Pedobacter sp. HMF7647]|uniref:Uncharacterized protein n=1 Tax=Hufsiella arboris TaxID=2695275 RepID=A0A7K1YFG6_9SPHI|nr:hypothetical protein [Hufsiella arboris]MXV53343.1 hypothetical protein [Hufsiella arboris]
MVKSSFVLLSSLCLGDSEVLSFRAQRKPVNVMGNYTNLLLFSILLLLTSCEGMVQGNGKIVSSTDGKPIEGTLIFWTVFNEKVYSDKTGHFEVGKFCGCVPECPKLEVVFFKKGYKTRYIDLNKKFDYKTDSLTIKMTPSATSEELKEGRWSSILQALLILVSIFNLGTLTYIVSNKTEYKMIWLVAMVIFSTTIEYNYFNGDHNIHLFNFLFQFSNIFGWYRYFIPTTAVVFWANHWFNKVPHKKTSN